MHRMRLYGGIVAMLALLGATSAWGQGQSSDSAAVSPGWQKVEEASSVGGNCFVAKNRAATTKETAAWSLEVPSAGDYQIQVYVPPAAAQQPRTHSAMYLISR